jgi:hypothetical protein
MTPNDRDWSAHPGNLHQVRHLKHAPDITRAILLGAHPVDLNTERLKRNGTPCLLAGAAVACLACPG